MAGFEIISARAGFPAAVDARATRLDTYQSAPSCSGRCPVSIVPNKTGNYEKPVDTLRLLMQMGQMTLTLYWCCLSILKITPVTNNWRFGIGGMIPMTNRGCFLAATPLAFRKSPLGSRDFRTIFGRSCTGRSGLGQAGRASLKELAVYLYQKGAYEQTATNTRASTG